MTDFLLDLASYQAGIDLGVARRAGFSLVNIKTSQGNWYKWSSASHYANIARDLGFTVGTFHWLDNSASGAEQARIAYQGMKDLGGPDGMFHQCDCEDQQKPATFQIWRDYVNAMQDLLGRHIINYTGDWWWPKHMGQRGAEVTPYLWAAPNDGYDGVYLGDLSDHWYAGYGGWNNYAILQYSVQPITGAGGGDISKSAIRDPNVISALTGSGVDLMATASDVIMAWSQGMKNTQDGTLVAPTVWQIQFEAWRDGVNTRFNQLDDAVKKIGTLGTSGAPSQDQVNVAIATALQDPAIVKGIGDAIAAHLHVS